MNVILVTVSDDRHGSKGGRYGETQDKITDLFSKHPNFGIDVHPYKWEDILKTDFYRKNKTLLDNTDVYKNGLAYKPYVILRELKAAKAGNFIVYNDCSPEIWRIVENLDHFDLQVIKDLCVQANDILTPFSRWSSGPFKDDNDLGMATHKNFTLDRCMDRMGLRALENFYMHSCAMLCIRKTKKTVEFLQTWLEWNCIDECSTKGRASDPNDYSYWEEEKSHKLGMVYDQSISSLLLARDNHKFVALPAVGVDDMHPVNFLHYCRKGAEYRFIGSNPEKDG